MKRLLGSALLLSLLLCGCTWDKVEPNINGFPDEIQNILVTSCATGGCHTLQSAPAAANLNLMTWQNLFEGSRGGSPVVPYSPELSYLLYSVNTDTARGATLNPTMPIGGAPLTDAEYETLRQWIADGARNHLGEERFPQTTTRRKWYVTNQGCDLVAVFDAKSRQIMRYVSVGRTPGFSESPHNIKVSNDGQFWYVVFLGSNPYIEKYSTLTDEKVGEILIGSGQWNTFTISADGKFGIAVSYDVTASGIAAAIVDLERDTLTEPLYFSNVSVHGSAAHPTLSRFYITQQEASSLFSIDYNSSTGRVTNVNPIDLEQGVPPSVPGALKPHEVFFTPDGSKFLVTCQATHEVRIYDGVTNALQTVLQVGDDPVEFAIDASRGHIFVSCMNDGRTYASESWKVGSIWVIDYNTNSIVKHLYSGYQPHGLVVDQTSGYLLITNRNVDPTGPAPHHSPLCGTRNGYLTAIDLNTLELVPEFKPELSNDPYSVALKK
jgi:DNA-binding beta-propeller fold protein YncE